MKRIAVHIIIFFLSIPAVFGQSPLSLETCREAARNEGKLEELYTLIALDQEANARLEQHPFLLSISAYGTASYQTDAPNPASVTDFPFVLHASPKFQYHAGFLMAQPIYSGGQRRVRSELNDVEHEIQRTNLDSRGVELDSAVERGDVSGMSFMFTVDGEEWEGLDSERPVRHITSIGQIFEVSAVTWPAYEQTSINARSLDSVKASLDSAKEALESARRSEELRKQIIERSETLCSKRD